MTLNQLIYRVTRPLGGLKVARFLSRNHPKILMYHRITEDPEGEGLPVEQFKRQVEIIRKHFNPLTLRELMKAHEKGRVPKHAVCVTFDDGYADFGEIAFPILKEAGVPATLFVTTGFVNGDLWLWPDQIRFAIENTKKTSLKIDGIPEPIDLNHSKRMAWSVIANYCLGLQNEKKILLIRQIYDDLEITMPKIPPDRFKPVTWEALKDFISQGLDVGSHSVSHPILSKLDRHSLEKEIKSSKMVSETKLRFKTESFCYPNGLPGDFNNETISVVKNAGYKCAVTAFPNKNGLEDSWKLGRYGVGISIDDFKKNIYGMTYLYYAVFGKEI